MLPRISLRFVHSSQLAQPDSQTADAETKPIIRPSPRARLACDGHPGCRRRRRRRSAAGEDPSNAGLCPKVKTVDDVPAAQVRPPDHVPPPAPHASPGLRAVHLRLRGWVVMSLQSDRICLEI